MTISNKNRLVFIHEQNYWLCPIFLCFLRKLPAFQQRVSVHIWLFLSQTGQPPGELLILRLGWAKASSSEKWYTLKGVEELLLEIPWLPTNHSSLLAVDFL